MGEGNQTTFSGEQGSGYFDAATRTDHGDGHGERAGSTRHSESGRGSTAAERLGGPSESEVREDNSRAGDTAGSGTAAGPGSGTAGKAEEPRATLIAPDRAESYRARWTEIKGDFVDEPRRAVRGANELVGEVLDQLEELFRTQRSEIENGLDSNDTTTEDLRLALGRYRTFFDRLLSI